MELFGTAGIRGDVTTTVTPELALEVGRALGERAGTVVVGRDGRVTGPALAAAATAGIESAGGTVRRIGTVPTAVLAFASQGRHGLMVTASHNPPADNGLKLFVDGVEFDADAEGRIETRIAEGVAPAGWDAWGDSEPATPGPAYRTAVAAYARRFGVAPEGLRVAVDCGNGMGGRATPQVLRALGADVVAINANVDGRFTARASKPTADALADLRAFLAGSECAFGIAHDGDADRIVILDDGGEIVHEDTVLAILAERYVRASDAADPIVVTTPNASGRIDERVAAAGGRTERVRLGGLHEGIARVRGTAGDTDTEVVFAAEPWKHIHPAFGGWIDGTASAAVLTRLVAAAGGIDALRAPVTERPYRKTNVRCPDAAKPAAMERLETSLPERFPDASLDTAHGVRLDMPDGSWVLVRPSGTEPYVRIYAESESVDALVGTVTDAVETAVAAATPSDGEAG